MKKKLLISTLSLLCFANQISAQFVVKDIVFSANSVTNEGKVSGFEMQTGPYAIWLPDSSNTVIQIGGVAPGDGVGGQARFSADGNFICGTSMGTGEPEMSRYNRTTKQWTKLGGLGVSIDGTVSGGYNISGDGNTVVGLAWADSIGGNIYSTAIAWNETEDIMDLGTLYPGASTRANAVSDDGSIVVGWQFFDSPWKSAVWEKNPAGGYFPNKYILIDTAGSATDEFNQMGECSTVSGDGKWIGGYGDFANEYQPWIWNKDSGIINLGTFPNVGNGNVSGMSSDASIVVGWFDAQLFGDPVTPFIWTRETGLRELNDYVQNDLGYTTGSYLMYGVESISPDGKYIAGYGVKTSTNLSFVFRLGLTPSSNVGIQEINTMENAHVYPNPTNDILTIENLTSQVTLIIRSMDGKAIYETIIDGKSVVDMSKYATGIYSLSLQSGNSIQTQKVIKR